MRKFLIFFFITQTIFASEVSFDQKYSLQNYVFSSQGIEDKEYYTRLRGEYDFGFDDKLELKIIGDMDGDNETALRSSFYRAYATAYLPNSTLEMGLQRIPFGVGRIWNPTDILNPPNPLSVDPGERTGVEGYHYTYNINNLTQVFYIYTFDDDGYVQDVGGRLRTNYNGFDLGISAIKNNNLKMTGLEIDGEFLDTGIGIRTEIGYFENRLLEDKYYKYVLGADYMFPNTFYLVVEYLVNEAGTSYPENYDFAVAGDPSSWNQLAKNYLGISASFEFTPLIVPSLSYIHNLNDGSYMLGPNVKWNLADSLDSSLGATYYNGYRNDEFAYYHDLYYLSIGGYF